MQLILLTLISSVFCIPICLLLALLIFNRLKSRGKKGGLDSGGSSGPSNKTTVPFDSILKTKASPWYTQSLGNQERLSVSNGILRLRYVKNAHGASSGAKASALPLNKFPANELEIGYDVFFPDTFEWKKGGKLPGVCLGTSSKECATGGDWKNGEGSCRFMWRSKDNKNAYIIGYVYLPTKDGHVKRSYDRQGAGYKRVTDPGDRTGHDLWHGELPIKKGWNSLRMKLKMNTPGKQDGLLEIEVNGQVRRVTDVLWRDSEKTKISNLNFVSFFGGGDSSWDSNRDTYTEYRNFWIA